MPFWLKLCFKRLDASFECPVVNGPPVDGLRAIGCLNIFGDDVICVVSSASGGLCSLQPRVGATKSALLWPMHCACHDRLFVNPIAYPRQPSIAHPRPNLDYLLQSSFLDPLVARPVAVVLSLVSFLLGSLFTRNV